MAEITTRAEEAAPAPESVPNGAEYRGVVECTDDPCTYCRHPKGRYFTANAFDNPEEALFHARRLSEFVYGSGVHRSSVETRTPQPWVPYTFPEKTR